MPRAKAGTNYLTRTLESLMDELPKDPTGVAACLLSHLDN